MLDLIYSDDYRILKIGIALLTLILFGWYSNQNRIHFNPTLADCLSSEHLVQEGSEVIFEGFFKKSGKDEYLVYGEKKLQVDTSMIRNVPHGKLILLVGECRRNSVIKVLRWESRNNIKYLKYLVSILGLGLSLLFFFKFFTFSNFLFRLR